MVAAIAAGLWGGLFASGIFTGMYDTMVSAAIDRQYGHFQIHAKDFRSERLITMVIPDADTIVSGLRNIPGVVGVTGRTVIDGMGSSTASNQGVTIVGVDPEAERSVTTISRRLVAGTYFQGDGRNPILIGRKLAEKLSLHLYGKIVLAFQNFDGTIVYGAFRIVGIFDTEADSFDGTTVLVRRADLERLTGREMIHEIAVRLSTNDSLVSVSRRVAQEYPSLSVETWKDLAPDLRVTAESADITMEIFLGVILLALLFGITNTMLMSVLERTREFGVLIAVGMKRRRVFMMVVVETIFLSITGSIVGVALGVASMWLTAYVGGISLAWFSAGLSAYGISSTLIPVVHAAVYPVLAVMVMVAACGAALYPAMKAIRLNPASAIATYG